MSVLVESKRVRPEFFHSKFCDRRRCRAVNALTAAAATLSRHFRDSFRAGGVTSKAKPVSASGYFFVIPTKKSNFSDFRSTFWSILLFWYVVVRNTFWGGLLF